jgi:hypothetical protein
MLGACGHPVTPAASAGPGKEAAPSVGTDDPSVAWERAVDENTRKAVEVILDRIGAGALSSYEADHVGVDSQLLPKRFPGDERSHWTLDCCRPSLDCNDDPRWKDQDPWISLNFAPPEYDPHLRFDFRSTGTERGAQFLAVVSVDPKCDGHPIYVWRRGTIDENGDISGNRQPGTGDRPPELKIPSSH